MDDKDYVVGGDTAPGVRRAKLEQQLRRLEVEAYCAVVSAFRAQGELTWKKAQLLQDLRQVLRVPEERHKMELKRVTDDETLAELAKLSAGLHTLGDDDAKKSRAGRKKAAGNAWGGDSGSRDKTLPYLDAVVVTPSSQPPNLSKIPAVAAAKGGAKGGAKGAAAPKAAGAKAAGAASAAAANRKRKAPSTATSAASTKGGAPAAKKRATKPSTKGAAANVKTDADASLMELSGAEVGEENEAAAAALGGDGEEDEEQDEAHIKEVEEQLRAKQEQLKAELAALQAEMEEDDEEEEGEEELEEADEGQQQQQQQMEGEGEQGAGDGDVDGDSALRDGAEVEAAAAQEVAMGSEE